MEINVLVFGQFRDLIGEQLSIEDMQDTDALVLFLHEKYPALLEQKYMLAVDKTLVVKNIPLTNESMVALMPAFSGG